MYMVQLYILHVLLVRTTDYRTSVTYMYHMYTCYGKSISLPGYIDVAKNDHLNLKNNYKLLQTSNYTCTTRVLLLLLVILT